MDLVGPRHIKGDGRFYSLNLIDTSTHMVHIHLIRSKSADEILPGLVEFWSRVGLPDCIQMDNELAFRGSNRHPRSLGVILRFILSQGVIARFIPPGEPWRNGIIEKFNDRFDKMFFRIQRFASLKDLTKEARVFQSFHNANHRYSAHKGRTPCDMRKLLGEMPSMKLPQGFDPKVRLPLEEGTISFVRFIRSDRILDVFNTKFKVKKELIYSYVEADVIIHKHLLVVSSHEVIHHRITFEMPVDWNILE